MAAGKHIDKICIIAVVVALIIAILAMNAQGLGIQAADREVGYESRIFDTGRVHTIDIVMDDWDGFLTTCQSEEYSLCSVVIDGEAVRNVGIRGKGNTSLSSVSSMDSDRYSFKIEFDQYDSTQSYYGLDKLSLNNLIQDNTMMKDYLVYRMMDEFGVNAPLCSFVYLTVNGEDWGLYLAVEGVEDSFLYRNYGSDYGELYKPDSMDMGGGRGNGRDFDFSAIEDQFGDMTEQFRQNGTVGQMPQEGFDPSAMFGGMAPEGMEMPGMQGDFGNMGGGMGSSDVKLQYIDDDPDSYSNIFDSAKTDITEADQTRLIQALEALSTGDPGAVDVEQVLRYFVVHNYVVNADSYTGSMVHNYYLYEEAGQLAMIPWDYNLAFGTFQGNNATSAVNDDIDNPLSAGTDRPMLAWIFADAESTAQYHSYFEEFLNTVDVQGIIDQAAELISPYVEKDPTKFCTYEEFETGVAALREFCTLRSQSVSNQLSGSSETVDASGLNLSDMGTMGNTVGGFGGMGGGRQDFRGETTVEPTEPSATEPTEASAGIVEVAEVESSTEESVGQPQFPGEMGGTPPDWGGQMPQGGMPGGDGTMPGGEMPAGGEMPIGGMPGEGMDPGTMPSEGMMPSGLTQEENSATEPTEPQESASENIQTIPGGDRSQMEGMQNMQPGVQTAAGQSNQWLLLGVCVAVLLLGLLIAWRYRR